MTLHTEFILYELRICVTRKHHHAQTTVSMNH